MPYHILWITTQKMQFFHQDLFVLSIFRRMIWFVWRERTYAITEVEVFSWQSETPEAALTRVVSIIEAGLPCQAAIWQHTMKKCWLLLNESNSTDRQLITQQFPGSTVQSDKVITDDLNVLVLRLAKVCSRFLHDISFCSGLHLVVSNTCLPCVGSWNIICCVVWWKQSTLASLPFCCGESKLRVPWFSEQYVGGKSLSVLILMTILSWKAICEAIASEFLQRSSQQSWVRKRLLLEFTLCPPSTRDLFRPYWQKRYWKWSIVSLPFIQILRCQRCVLCQSGLIMLS